MTQKKRLTITAALGIILELFSKIAPLIILSLIVQRLGLEKFGYSQIIINSLEMLLPLILFGYGQYATVHFSLCQSHDEKRELISAILLLKFCHWLVVTAVLGHVLWHFPSFISYKPALLTGTVILGIMVLENNWLFTAKQKLSGMHILICASKFVSLGAIILLIQSPEHTLRFVALFFIPQLVIASVTFIWACKTYPLLWPPKTVMFKIIRSSWPYALVSFSMIALHRIDALLVEQQLGHAAAGLYTGPQRLVHSLMQIFGAISVAFFSEILIAGSITELTQRVRQNSWACFSLFAPLFAGTVIVAEPLLELIFNEAFLESAPILVILVLGILPSVFGDLFGHNILISQRAVWPLLRSLFIGFLSFAGSAWLLLNFTSITALFAVAYAALISRTVIAVLNVAAARPYLLPLKLGFLLRPLIAALLMWLGLWLYNTESLWLNIGLGVLLYGALFPLVHIDYLRQAKWPWH